MTEKKKGPFRYTLYIDLTFATLEDIKGARKLTSELKKRYATNGDLNGVLIDDFLGSSAGCVTRKVSVSLGRD